MGRGVVRGTSRGIEGKIEKVSCWVDTRTPTDRQTDSGRDTKSRKEAEPRGDMETDQRDRRCAEESRYRVPSVPFVQ